MENAKLNEVLDMLIMEAYAVYQDINAMATLLKVCPNCSVKHADVIAALEDVGGGLIDIMARLKGTQSEGGDR